MSITISPAPSPCCRCVDIKKKCIQYSALGAIAQLSIIAIKSFPILEEFTFSHRQNYSVLIRGTIGTIADILWNGKRKVEQFGFWTKFWIQFEFDKLTAGLKVLEEGKIPMVSSQASDGVNFPPNPPPLVSTPFLKCTSQAGLIIQSYPGKERREWQVCSISKLLLALSSGKVDTAGWIFKVVQTEVGN